MGFAAWCPSEGDEPLVQWTPLGYLTKLPWVHFQYVPMNLYVSLGVSSFAWSCFLSVCSKCFGRRDVLWTKPCSRFLSMSVFKFGKVWSMWCTVCQIQNPDIVILVASLWWLGSWHPKKIQISRCFMWFFWCIICQCASCMKFSKILPNFRLSLFQIMTRW